MAERIRRSPEERIEELDQKIQDHKNAIKKLTERKEAILNPKPRMTKSGKIKVIVNQAKASGMSPEEIAEKLGLHAEF